MFLNNCKLDDYPDVSLKAEKLPAPVCFEEIFGRCAPVHVEIGSGKGTFLVNQAQAQPEVNFLGIEWASKFYRYAVNRIGRWDIKHVRMLRTDAAIFVRDYIPDASVDCFHIYYPDPWPKKRHHKRRLICPANVEQFARCLKKGGIIRLATDHNEYFEQMTEVMGRFSGIFDRIDFEETAGAKDGEFVGTNFERKYIAEGRDMNHLAVRKK